MACCGAAVAAVSSYMHALSSLHSRTCSLDHSDDISRGQMELPERVLRELQAEAAVMSHMRHPK